MAIEWRVVPLAFIEGPRDFSPGLRTASTRSDPPPRGHMQSIRNCLHSLHVSALLPMMIWLLYYVSQLNMNTESFSKLLLRGCVLFGGCSWSKEMSPTSYLGQKSITTPYIFSVVYLGVQQNNINAGGGTCCSLGKCSLAYYITTSNNQQPRFAKMVSCQGWKHNDPLVCSFSQKWWRRVELLTDIPLRNWPHLWW